MISLFISILLLTVIFFVSREYPYLAGILAIIPVKILSASFIAFELGQKEQLFITVKSMLIGQFLVGFVLLGVYWVLK